MTPSAKNAPIPILLAQFISAVSYGIMVPLLPYYASTYGATPLVNGLLLASYAACAFVAGPILGDLSDRHGRRPLMVFCLLGSALGFAILGIGGSLWVLFLGRIIDGISGGNAVVANAYITDVMSPEERTHTFGMMGAATGVGIAVGPLISSGLSAYSLSAPMWVASALALIAAIVAFLLMRAPARAQDVAQSEQHNGLSHQLVNIARVVVRPSLRPLMLLYACMALAMSLFVSSLGQLMQIQVQTSASQAGYPVAAFGITLILSQIFMLRPLIRKIGERMAIAVGLPIIACAGLIMFITTSLLIAILSACIMAVGVGLLRPSITALITTVAENHETGRVLGVSTSLNSLSQAIAPVIGGMLIAQYSAGAPGLLLVAIGLLGCGALMATWQHLPSRVQVAASHS